MSAEETARKKVSHVSPRIPPLNTIAAALTFGNPRHFDSKHLDLEIHLSYCFLSCSRHFFILHLFLLPFKPCTNSSSTHISPYSLCAAPLIQVDKVKGEQSSLIATLERQQRKMEEGALLVELFADDVDKCMLVINSALTAGMSWDDIDTMVKAETAKGELVD